MLVMMLVKAAIVISAALHQRRTKPLALALTGKGRNLIRALIVDL